MNIQNTSKPINVCQPTPYTSRIASTNTASFETP